MNIIEMGNQQPSEFVLLLNLKVHRPTANNGVGSSDPKYWRSFLKDRDMVNSTSKDVAVNNGTELTTPCE